MLRQYYNELMRLTVSIKSSYENRMLELIPGLAEERRRLIEKIKEIEGSRTAVSREGYVEEIVSLAHKTFIINEEIVIGMISEMDSIKSEIKSLKQQRAASNSYKKVSPYVS